LGVALWEQDIQLTASDVTSLPLDTPVIAPLTVRIGKAVPLTIYVDGQTLAVSSAGATVGEALAEAGLALENLDKSIPADDQPIPADGVIQVVRVREETILEESAIAYAEVREADEDMEIGTEEIRQAGQNGVQVTSVRVRYEDGQEVSRETEQEWVSQQPIDQITAYGSQVIVRTSADAECIVDYYLAKDVFVTSYHDTGQTTASGIWPYYGVIAVSPEWYSILKGSSICVPGYGVGTVLDVCPGCSGKDWLDVFIPTAEYTPWSKNLTAYFMPPMPSGFTGDLP
jgi:3D (Asp-Asp-Asp) domain-containing protein